MTSYIDFRDKLFSRIPLSYFGFLGSGIILLSMIITAIMYRSPTGQYYNPLNHFISELGYIGVSDFAWLFNGSIFVGGLVLACFMWGLGVKLNTRLLKISSFIGMLACILGSLIGIFPMNIVNTHIVIAMAFFISSTIAIILFSIGIYVDPEANLPKALVWYGCIVVFAFIFFLFNPFDTSAVNFTGSFTQQNIANLDNIRPVIWNIAILEWLSVLSIILWIVIVSIIFRNDTRYCG